LEIEVRRIECSRCPKVKQEKLDRLADNPSYSKRFAFFVVRPPEQMEETVLW
jgi:transposase